MADDRLKYRWRDAVLSENGPPATTRHVLLVLSTHMDQDGGSCFPSTRLLATETGLSRRTVMRRLEDAERGGWLQRRERGCSGRGWKRHEYAPTIPDAVTEVHHDTPEGGDRGSPRNPGRGDSDDNDVVTESHLSSSIESPPTTDGGQDVYGGQLPKPSHLVSKGESSHLVYPPAFETVWAAYPDRDGENPKKAAYRVWRTAVTNGTDPNTLLTATRHYAQAMESRGKTGTEFVKMANTFFGPDDYWRGYVEPPDTNQSNGSGYERLT